MPRPSSRPPRPSSPRPPPHHPHITLTTDRLYLGSFEGATDVDALKARGITHIINCAIELNYSAGPEFKELRLYLDDVPQQSIAKALDESHRFISEAMRDPRAKVFVHCYAGISRSSSVVINHIMRTYRQPYDVVFASIRERRPIIQPNEGFEATLRKISARLGL